MSSSPPCQTAYQLALATITVGSTASLVAIAAFVLYAVELHYRPNRRFASSKYDIESATWLMMLTSTVSLATASAVIANYLCGPTCPSTVINCNTQIGQYSSTLITTVSALGAACMKIAAFYHQRTLPRQDNPEGPDWLQLLHETVSEDIRREFRLHREEKKANLSSANDLADLTGSQQRWR